MHCTPENCPEVSKCQELEVPVDTRVVLPGHTGHYYTVCVTTGHIVDAQVIIAVLPGHKGH